MGKEVCICEVLGGEGGFGAFTEYERGLDWKLQASLQSIPL
ncbi:hypothetical protein A2U01_0076289 [Trifolium medium]|uniref:Uncharacterized protein n=1 Tax=Trifolium medium TaxID=97028 RepID=A0A392T1Z5_9FABA|nr:hypothetical protein [Trifolium medium]